MATDRLLFVKRVGRHAGNCTAVGSDKKNIWRLAEDKPVLERDRYGDARGWAYPFLNFLCTGCRTARLLVSLDTVDAISELRPDMSGYDLSDELESDA